MHSRTSSTNSFSVTADGLEEIFEAITDGYGGTTEDPGWSLSEAAEHFNVTERTVRRWIKERRLSAWKVDGPRGPEWRIHRGTTVADEVVQSGSDERDRGSDATLNLLTEILKEQAAKLEAATFRNGFLEAQTSAQQDQLKLLPDLEAQAKRGADLEARSAALERELAALKATWLYRLCSIFVRRST